MTAGEILDGVEPANLFQVGDGDGEPMEVVPDPELESSRSWTSSRRWRGGGSSGGAEHAADAAVVAAAAAQGAPAPVEPNPPQGDDQEMREEAKPANPEAEMKESMRRGLDGRWWTAPSSSGTSAATRRTRGSLKARGVPEGSPELRERIGQVKGKLEELEAAEAEAQSAGGFVRTSSNRSCNRRKRCSSSGWRHA